MLHIKIYKYITYKCMKAFPVSIKPYWNLRLLSCGAFSFTKRIPISCLSDEPEDLFMTMSLVNTSFMEYVPAYNFPCANFPIIECHQTHSALRRAICIFDDIRYGLQVANTVGGLSSKISYILLKKNAFAFFPRTSSLV